MATTRKTKRKRSKGQKSTAATIGAELDAIELRWKAGPWLAIVDRGGGRLEITDIRANDIPWLIAEVRRLQERPRTTKRRPRR